MASIFDKARDLLSQLGSGASKVIQSANPVNNFNQGVQQIKQPINLGFFNEPTSFKLGRLVGQGLQKIPEVRPFGKYTESLAPGLVYGPQIAQSYGKTIERITTPKLAISQYKSNPLETGLEDLGNLADFAPAIGIMGLTKAKGATSALKDVKPMTKIGDVIKNRSNIIGDALEGHSLGSDGLTDPVQKIINLLSEAKPMRGQQEALYSAERSRRAAAVAGVGSSVPGERGFFAQLGQLKGELPKVQFERIRNGLQQGDIDSLFDKVEQSGGLSIFEKITAKGGLAKLLGETGGVVPNKSEIKLLDGVFGSDFTKAVMNKRPLMEKVLQAAGEILNIPRAIMATGDLSAPLRQGIFMIGRPKEFVPAMGKMFKYFGSEKAYQGLAEDIASRPTFNLMKDSKLALTNINAPALVDREEAFMSNLVEKIPLFGKLAHASDRAYTGFLTKLRADSFDNILQSAKNTGVEITPKLTDDLAHFINAATGRGKLPGPIEKAAVALNSVFFSPRLMASRLETLNPMFYVNLDPFVRKQAITTGLKTVGVLGTILGLAKASGAKVGTDPRSADFGKIKIGNSRVDMLGGYSQYARLFSQLATGKIISSTTGKEITLGEGYKALTRKDIIYRFLESKENPIASFLTTLITGKNGIGDPANIPSEVISRFIPMLWQDMYDVYKDSGSALKTAGLGALGALGAGAQTYGKQELVEGQDQLGQTTSAIQPIKSLPDAISQKVFGQQPLGSSSSWNVSAYYDQLLKMPKDQAAAKFDEIIKTNPDLAKKIIEEIKDRQQGVTIPDKTLKAKGVASGDRSTALAKEFKNAKTNGEKAKLWDHYVKIGVITSDIAKQLKILKDRGDF